MNIKVTVLGAGAWGTAIATLLAHNGYDVVLWCYEQDVANDINLNGFNSRYLPGIQLQKNIKATNNLQESIQASPWLFEAVPVTCLKSVFASAKTWVTPEHRIVVLSKGIDSESSSLPVEIITAAIKGENQFAVLGGPNFAHELAQQVPTASVVASSSISLIGDLAKMLNNRFFKVYGSDDIIGVQVGGAFKNVMALVLGIANGAKYRENTTAYFMTQGLDEMAKIAVALGGKAETVYGLSGFGDLVLCCTGSLSRNFKIGQLLGQGAQLSSLADKFPVLPEGVNTLQIVKVLADRHALTLPLCGGTYGFVFAGKPFDEVLDTLMNAEKSFE